MIIAGSRIQVSAKAAWCIMIILESLQKPPIFNHNKPPQLPPTQPKKTHQNTNHPPYKKPPSTPLLYQKLLSFIPTSLELHRIVGSIPHLSVTKAKTYCVLLCVISTNSVRRFDDEIGPTSKDPKCFLELVKKTSYTWVFCLLMWERSPPSRYWKHD